MGIRIIFLLVIICFSCDPSRKYTFVIENQSREQLDVFLYHRAAKASDNKEDTFTLLPISDKIIVEFESIGGGFRTVAGFDSIIFERGDRTKLAFYRPENVYGYIDTLRGTPERDTVPHDIYNVYNWQYEKDGYDESWIYTLTSADLLLFK